jgi:hypothetical protein
VPLSAGILGNLKLFQVVLTLVMKGKRVNCDIATTFRLDRAHLPRLSRRKHQALGNLEGVAGSQSKVVRNQP